MTNKRITSETDKLRGVFAGIQTSERPWISIFAQMHDHAMTLAGIPTKKYYRDARLFVDVVAEVSAYYELDSQSLGADVFNFEIEGMGGKMVFGENSMPTIDFRDPLVKSPEDLRQLRTPDFHRDGRLPFALGCMKYGKEYGIFQGIFCAPFSMAVGMRSFPALIRDMRKQPKFAHDLLTFIIDEVLVPYLKVQKDELGLTFSVGADAWCSIPNLSVKEMKEWVVPYNQRLFAKAKEFGMTVSTFSGDYCEERLEKFDIDVLYGAFEVQIASQGTPSIMLAMGRWQDFPLEPVVKFLDKYKRQGIRVAVSAGVNARLLRDGPVNKIVDYIKRIVDTFARDHDLTMSLANIPADTPSEHIHAAVAATHTYGLKPIAADLNIIKLKVPEKEPFAEWKKRKIAQTAP
jgi:uroporphyrinogen-III decarboxylase